jgi:AcrR family transcriptional regulator
VVPKIDASSIIAQRAMRQRQLMDAALSIAFEGGAEHVTVSAVAARAGISRSAVYEYFSSSADLISDLILEELEFYRVRLLTAVKDESDPVKYVELWISEALTYIVDGRHMVAKSLNSISIPEFRRAEIASAHRELMETIAPQLSQLGISDLRGALVYLQNTLDTAAVRIDSGNDAAPEILTAQRYAVAGLRALATREEVLLTQI